MVKKVVLLFVVADDTEPEAIVSRVDPPGHVLSGGGTDALADALADAEAEAAALADAIAPGPLPIPISKCV